MAYGYGVIDTRKIITSSMNPRPAPDIATSGLHDYIYGLNFNYESYIIKNYILYTL
jgi:hypothetical protein